MRPEARERRASDISSHGNQEIHRAVCQNSLESWKTVACLNLIVKNMNPHIQRPINLKHNKNRESMQGT